MLKETSTVAHLTKIVIEIFISKLFAANFFSNKK